MKMKLLTGLLTGIFIIGIVGNVKASLINGNFELGDLTGWEVSENPWFPYYSVSIDDTDAYEGNYCAVIIGNANIYQSFDPISSHSIQSISLSYKTQESGGIYLYYDDSTRSDIILLSTYGVVGQWNTIDITQHLDINKNLCGIELSGYQSHDPMFYDNISINPVPEPATILLFGSGLAGLFSIKLRRKS